MFVSSFDHLLKNSAPLLRGICFSTVASLAIACGGASQSVKPQTGADGAQASGDGSKKITFAEAAKPQRDVSGEAKSSFEAALKKYSAAKSANGQFDKGQCGDIAEAFDDVFKAHPKIVEAKFNVAVIWENCGDVSKAEQAYQAILDKQPDFGPALNNLGQLYYRRGKINEAVSLFDRAAKSKNSEGYANLAMIQRNRSVDGTGSPDDVKEAIQNVHRALAVDSANIDAYNIKATILYDYATNRARLDLARLLCVQAMKKAPEYAPIYNVLGLVLLRMGEVTRALANFRKAATLNPNFLEAHMNIGAITLSFRDYKTAEYSFSKVISLNPQPKTKVAAMIGLGVALRGQKNFNGALAKYNEAKALDPQNTDIDFNMGILMQDYTFDATDPQKGIEQLQTAMTHLNRYISQGKSAEKKKDAEQRVKNIQEMIPLLREQQQMMKEAAQPEAPKS